MTTAYSAPDPRGILRTTTRPARWIVIAIVAVVLVAIGGALLAHHHPDLRLVEALNRLHTGALGTLTSAVYLAFRPVPALIITAVLAVVGGLATRTVRTAVAVVLVMAGTWLPSAIVKAFVHRHRPPVAHLAHPFHPIQHDASYPSGHVIFIVTLLLIGHWLLRDTAARPVYDVLAVVVGVLLIASILIDGVHYPTDALASVVWALGVAPLVQWLWVGLIGPHVPVLGRPRPVDPVSV